MQWKQEIGYLTQEEHNKATKLGIIPFWKGITIIFLVFAALAGRGTDQLKAF